MVTRRTTPYNTGFASGGLTCKLEALCFYLSSVLADSFVLRNPPERKARKRYLQAEKITPKLDKDKLKITLILTLLPTLVFANAGSPMMWFGLLHSLILNSLIGIYESRYLEKKEISNRMWLIIIGNYFSMFIGLYYIAPYFSTISGNIDFWGGNTSYGEYELNGFIFGMLASFIATLILELPFYLLSVKEKEKRKKGIWTYIEANTITNVVMFLIYFIIVVGGSK